MKLRLQLLIVGAALGTALIPAASASSLFASYTFQNTLSADQSGVPALTAVDPENLSGFTTATVNGVPRTVYQWSGNNVTPANEAGLSFNGSGLTPNDYSVQMVFSFSQSPTGWRRILDVQNRASDSGFYLDPSGNLDLAGYGLSLANGSDTFNLNTFYDVVLVNSGGNVAAYLDGSLQFLVPSNVMDINNPGGVINLFLDDQGTYGTEYSNGQIALFNVWNGGLTSQEVMALDQQVSGVPEPSSWLTAICGFVLIGAARITASRRRA
jgi:Concanavalin A-like lectin/glucanases superfamily